MSAKPVKSFQVKHGAPTVIEITRDDGTRYALSVVLAVHGVTDKDQQNADGTPQFELRVALASDTRPL